MLLEQSNPGTLILSARYHFARRLVQVNLAVSVMVARALDLEYEIIMLRKDIESLRLSLGVEDKFSYEPPKPKPEETKKGKLKFKILK